MLSILRLSSSSRLGPDWLGEALLNLAFLRMGLPRGRSADELPDHLRRDVGLPPRQKALPDPRDWR